MLPARKHNYEAWLVPYAEGTLDAARAALLEARMARDPRLAAEADRVRTVTAQLCQAAALSTSEADPRLALDPASLWPGVQRRLASNPRRLLRPAHWIGGVCAASFALGVLLLHGLLSGMGPRQTPLPARLRTANAGSVSGAGSQASARQRRKKAGRRLHARPVHLASSTARPLTPARTAAHFPVPPPELNTSALPAPVPSPAAPSAHTAVAWGDGSAHFRLASPVHDTLQEGRPRTDTDSSDERTGPASPAPDKPALPDNAAQTPTASAPAPNAAASAPMPPSVPPRNHARKMPRHQVRHRHQTRPPAAPASEFSPPPPAAATPAPHNPRIL